MLCDHGIKSASYNGLICNIVDKSEYNRSYSQTPRGEVDNRQHHLRALDITDHFLTFINSTILLRVCSIPVLNLEATVLTATTGLFKLASLTPDTRLDTIVCMRIVDRSPLSKEGQGSTALRTTEQHSVGSSRRPQGELIEGDAFTPSSNNALACILSEGESADTHLGTFKHAHIVGDLSNHDSDLTLLLGHVLGKTVQAKRGCVHLGHMKTLSDSGAEFGVRTARKEFVELNKETCVRVLRLDDPH